MRKSERIITGDRSAGMVARYPELSSWVSRILAACLVAKFAEVVQPGLRAMLRGFGAPFLLPLAAQALQDYFILHHRRASFLPS